MALAHCAGRVDIVRRTTPERETRGGVRDSSGDRLFNRVCGAKGREMAERRDCSSRCRGSISGHRVCVAACCRRHIMMPSMEQEPALLLLLLLLSLSSLSTSAPSTAAAERMSHSHKPADGCCVFKL